jgi:hypothetical protein
MDEEEREREDQEEQEYDEHPEKAAAESGIKEQKPKQDETESGLFDTDAHSDAPGPFGTG